MIGLLSNIELDKKEFGTDAEIFKELRRKLEDERLNREIDYLMGEFDKPQVKFWPFEELVARGYCRGYVAVEGSLDCGREDCNFYHCSKHPAEHMLV